MSEGTTIAAVVLCALNVLLAVRDKDIHAALGWLAAALYAAMGVAK